MFTIFRLFGVTTLDVVRASTFVSEIHKDLSLAPSVTVPVIGGHSGVTVCYCSRFAAIAANFFSQIVPLLSQSSHPLPNLSADEHAALIKRIQFGGDEVVKAKDGAGSATLSMAYAGAEFTAKVLRAVKGEKGIVAPSYINLTADKAGGEAVKKEIGQALDYFSVPVELGVSLHWSETVCHPIDFLLCYSPRVLLVSRVLAKLQKPSRNLSKLPCLSSR
jgi:malate dehydrogenase